ncbi:MAG TPA: hypothetical protein EYP63_00640 [Desulfotomaculum sp.]|nr:hypothetical protein [Desulfotomaculum sp.]
MRLSSREDVLSLVGQIDHIMEALQLTVAEARTKMEEFERTVPTRFDLRGIGSLYMLDWERIKPLLTEMDVVYRRFKEEIATFRSFLVRLADELT